MDMERKGMKGVRVSIYVEAGVCCAGQRKFMFLGVQESQSRVAWDSVFLSDALREEMNFS